MKNMQVDWLEFKQFVDDRGLSVQWIDWKGSYWLRAFDSFFSIECVLKKQDPIPQGSGLEDFVNNYKNNGNKKLDEPVKQSSFTAKEENGKKLFTRSHGAKYNLTQGLNHLEFAVPYVHVKFNAIEIINCEKLDSISLKILDTNEGLISGVSNFELNQFGDTVYLPDNFYVRESQYDAELYGGMIIKIEYNSQVAKEIAVNFLLHELKT